MPDMDPLPANTVPTSGKSAAPSAEATGAGDAESQPIASTPSTERTEAQIMEQFLADATDSTPQAETSPPEENEEHEGTDDAPKAGDGTQGGEESGQLDHLIDALVKDPENEKIRTRISKILGESPHLKQQVKDLTAKLQDSEGPPIVVRDAPTADDPLAQIGTEADLVNAQKQARITKDNAQAWVDWLTDNRDGGIPPGSKEELDAEAIRAKLAEARSQVRWASSILEAVPEKQAWLKKYGETRAALRESNPELFAKDSPELADVVQLVQSGTIDTRDPEYMRHALDLLEGRKARQDRERGIKTLKLDPKQAGKTAAQQQQTQRPGPQGGAGGVTKGASVRPAGAGQDVAAVKQQAEKGSQKARATLIDIFATQG